MFTLTTVIAAVLVGMFFVLALARIREQYRIRRATRVLEDSHRRFEELLDNLSNAISSNEHSDERATDELVTWRAVSVTPDVLACRHHSEARWMESHYRQFSRIGRVYANADWVIGANAHPKASARIEWEENEWPNDNSSPYEFAVA